MSLFNRFIGSQSGPGNEDMEEQETEVDIAEAQVEINESMHPDAEGTVECHWCEKDNDYEVELEEGKQEYTTRCDNCGLKIWIQGDGWEKYAEVHNLEEGCKAPSPRTLSEGQSDSARPWRRPSGSSQTRYRTRTSEGRTLEIASDHNWSPTPPSTPSRDNGDDDERVTFSDVRIEYNESETLAEAAERLREEREAVRSSMFSPSDED